VDYGIAKIIIVTCSFSNFSDFDPILQYFRWLNSNNNIKLNNLASFNFIKSQNPKRNNFKHAAEEYSLNTRSSA
jgi:hypothetical protein